MSNDYRMDIARAIVKFEARYDAKGRIKAYRLPPGDGGGVWEVAGICDRYHPHETADLVRLIEAGKYTEAEERAAEYIAAYTDCAQRWTTNRGIEAFMRDSVFNRGARGAVKILQMAVGFTGIKDVDGIFGPKTRAAVGKVNTPTALLAALRDARERYELEKVGKRAQFWKGLINRWNNATKLAQRYL